MTFFHDEDDGPAEPEAGLPEALPEGERVLWQGRPDTLGLAFGAFRLRWIAVYVLGVGAWRLAEMASAGRPASEMAAAAAGSLVTLGAAAALLIAIAYAMSRAALFTITSERVVLRYGVAIRKYVNAPFAQMASAQLTRRGARVGDIALQLESGGVPYLHLWPFARPFRFRKPQPMLRALNDAEAAAAILAKAARERAPDQVKIAPLARAGDAQPAPVPSPAAATAA